MLNIVTHCCSFLFIITGFHNFNSVLKNSKLVLVSKKSAQLSFPMSDTREKKDFQGIMWHFQVRFILLSPLSVFL